VTTTDRAPAGLRRWGGPSAGPGPDEGGRARHRPRSTRSGPTAGHRRLPGPGAGVWWNVWSQHPTSTTTCGCGDTSLFTWFLAWPAYAIAHGLDPLYSTAMFHPTA